MRKLPPEEAKQRRLASSRRWRAANPEKRRELNRDGAHRWYWANRAKALEANRERSQDWKEAHPSRLLASGARRRALKQRATVGDLQAIAAIYDKAKSAGRIRCAYCGRYPKPSERHVDHAVPLVRGGPHSAENLRIVCAGCNLAKGKFTAEEFAALRAA